MKVSIRIKREPSQIVRGGVGHFHEKFQFASSANLLKFEGNSMVRLREPMFQFASSANLLKLEVKMNYTIEEVVSIRIKREPSQITTFGRDFTRHLRFNSHQARTFSNFSWAYLAFQVMVSIRIKREPSQI